MRYLLDFPYFIISLFWFLFYLSFPSMEKKEKKMQILFPDLEREEQKVKQKPEVTAAHMYKYLSELGRNKGASSLFPSKILRRW